MIFEKFNSVEDHIKTIKDMFQDLIDDYDINVSINDHSAKYVGYNLNISSRYNNVGDGGDIKLYLRLLVDGVLEEHNLDVSNQIKRLESLGYFIKSLSSDKQIILDIDYSDV